jgi:hypothetical protein
MESLMSRISKLTAFMPDTALPVPAETPRSLTPQPATSESFAMSAASAIGGWAMNSLKKQVLGNGDVVPRPDSAPPGQTRFTFPQGVKGSNSGDVDALRDDGGNAGSKVRQNTTVAVGASTIGNGMKLQSQKKTMPDKVVEEVERESVDDEPEANWPGMEDWDDDEDANAAAGDNGDGWGFGDDD